LRAIRNVEKKNRRHTDLREVVATPGEILAEDTRGEFERDQATDDTRVKTAVAWMEEAELLQREENRVSILPSSLKVASLPEAKRIIDAKVSQPARRKALLDLVDGLFQADADEGISIDALMLAARLSSEEIRAALHDLDAMGILSNDSALTAFVDQAIARASQERFQEACALEIALIEQMRLLAPDLQPGDISQFYLSQAAQHLKDAGHAQAHPSRIQRLLGSLARDGAGDESAGGGSLELLRSHSRDVLPLRLKRPWQTLANLAEKRRAAAQHLLAHLLSKLPAGARGADLLVQTTQGQLMQAIKSDLTLQSNDPSRLLTRGLMWLHEQEIIRLNKGLTVFRSAMTLQLAPGTVRFKEQDYKPLRFHYDEQTFQIHVMLEYAELGLKAVADALNLVAGYFTLGKDVFIDRFLPNRVADLKRQTTPQSWERIVESLRNKAQKHIVANEREDQNLLVLAGPGSGKTRVLVHRLAYLIRCRRENPHGIIALAYNRHTAADIRRRLWDLIGGDAAGVTILTCHALAMSLVGASFVERVAGQTDFNEVMDEAIRLLQGGDISQESNEIASEAAEEQRERLLAGYRWLLVDEYQDVDARQYALISALAGRTLQDPDRKLNLLAVGDDDQNIYAWNGASVEFIRRFQADYNAQPAFLIENYRSSAHIIEAANRVIEKCAQRMKTENRITINRARDKEKAGGAWEKLDHAMSKGRVQILPCGTNLLTQAHAVMTELSRLASLNKDWDWSRTAVIARRWDSLQPLRAWCELRGIPAQMGNLEGINFWRLRETQTLLDWLKRIPSKLIDSDGLGQWMAKAPQGVWWDTLKSALDDYLEEIGSDAMPIAHLKDWLADFGRSLRRAQKGLLLTSAHGAKGLEFGHVAILDDEWSHRSAKEDADAPRRLFYVAMTRARQTLLLSRLAHPQHPFLADLSGSPCCFERTAVQSPLPEGLDLLYKFSTDIDWGYAGRHGANDAVHTAIAVLSTGDVLNLVQAGNVWMLLNSSGQMVGRMSKQFSPPADRTFVRGKVSAIIRHGKAQTDPAWQHQVRCDHWEVILPELVYQ
jgi:ATP-dependent DNA helicase RecQ